MPSVIKRHSAITLWLAPGVMCFLALFSAPAQVSLDADGPGNTYELIESALGAGTTQEVPDCAHGAFGRHITEEWDDALGKYVFNFHLHLTPDDDRCIPSITDRQRNEIKTFGPSPAYLKGFYGDTCTYRWKFKLDAGFQPSPNFTHIHQIKAGDGSDDDLPIYTLTPRHASPQRLELIYGQPASAGGNDVMVASAILSNFKGQWVQVTERITYRTNGIYELQIRRVNDNALLLGYTNNNVNLWRADATFVRPKWGIYRSLNSTNYLRDESVRFAEFCLAKGADVCADVAPVFNSSPTNQSVPSGDSATFSAVVTGSGPLRYQWRFNQTNLLAGATNLTFTLANCQPVNAGGYSLVASNSVGVVTSAVASLTVNGGPLASTNVLLQDLWLDGTRSDTALPVESAWYASLGSSLVAQSGALNGVPSPATGNTVNWWTYFTTNAAAPATLAEGETLRLTLSFTPTGVNAGNTSRGMRFGIYDSSAGSRTTADGSSPGGANHSGYLLDLNFGQTFQGTTMKFFERTNTANTTLINTTTGVYGELSSGGPVAGGPGFSNGVPHRLELLLQRTASALQLTATISSTNPAWTPVVFTGTDSNNFSSAFDMFVVRAATNGITATNLAITEFKVERITAGNLPPTPALHLAATTFNRQLLIAVTNLLATDTDPDGDALAVTAVAPLSTNAGTVTLTNNLITYQPPLNYTGADRLNYTLTDARGAAATGAVQITVWPLPQFGNATVAGGFIQLPFTGQASSAFIVQAKTNLTDPVWLTLATNVTGLNGQSVFSEAVIPNMPSRFYRLLLPW